MVGNGAGLFDVLYPASMHSEGGIEVNFKRIFEQNQFLHDAKTNLSREIHEGDKCFGACLSVSICRSVSLWCCLANLKSGCQCPRGFQENSAASSCNTAGESCDDDSERRSR